MRAVDRPTCFPFEYLVYVGFHKIDSGKYCVVYEQTVARIVYSYPWSDPMAISRNHGCQSVAVATLMFLAGQLAEFQCLPDMTPQGKEVLDAYVRKQAEALSECVKHYLALTAHLLARFQALTESERLQREYLVLAVAKAADVHAIVWPWEGEEDISLSSDDIVKYAQQLSVIFQTAEEVRLLWIADALEQILPVTS